MKTNWFILSSIWTCFLRCRIFKLSCRYTEQFESEAWICWITSDSNMNTSRLVCKAVGNVFIQFMRANKDNDSTSCPLFGDSLERVIHPGLRKRVTEGDKSGWMNYFLKILSVFHDPIVRNYVIFYALSNG